MRPFSATLLLTVTILFFATPTFATSQPYGWTISASSTNPFVNTTSATFGIDTFYLWLACCDVPNYPDGTPRRQGFTAAEFALVFTGIQILAVTALPGCNVGGENPPPPPDFLVLCFSCPCGPRPVASLLVFSFPGSICFSPSRNGLLGAFDCEPQPEIWALDWIGIDTTGAGAPCSAGLLCQNPVSVGDSSWGRVKSIYR